MVMFIQNVFIQASIFWFFKTRFTPALTVRLKQLYGTIGKYVFSGHSDIEENEIADQLAKK